MATIPIAPDELEKAAQANPNKWKPLTPEELEDRRRAVDELMGFAEKHGLKLPEGKTISDMIREARNGK